MRKILALVDDSLYSRSVSAYAGWLSAFSGAEIELLHVVSPQEVLRKLSVQSSAHIAGGNPIVLNGLTAELDPAIENAKARGSALLEETRAIALAQGAAAVTSRLAVGPVADCATEAAKGADIVVTGKRGEDADFANLTLGGTFKELVWNTETPVFIAPRVFRPVHNWMLAFDGGEDAHNGVRSIVAEGLLPILPCTMLHVGALNDNLALDLKVAGDKLETAGYPVTVDVKPGDVARLVPERVVATEMDLVALGGFRGSRFWSRLFGENLASDLIRACQTPLLLLR
jgi:nucleotide-binding universal stress UspA family protein